MKFVRVRGKFTGKLGNALRYDGSNVAAISELVGALVIREPDGRLILPDDDGVGTVRNGDWIIKSDEYTWVVSCSDAMFHALLEEV